MQLAEVVSQMDDVEATPLIGAERAEDEVSGNPLQAEAFAAAVEERVHLIDFVAEQVDELGAVHSCPMELIGAREGRSGRATRHLAEGEQGHL